MASCSTPIDQLRLNRQVHGRGLTGLDLDPLAGNDAGSVFIVHLDLVAVGRSTTNKLAVWL